MDRDWDAEWAAIEAEYQVARKAVDAVGLLVSSTPNGVSPVMNSASLASYRKAYRRFLDSTERRSSFFLERARHGST